MKKKRELPPNTRINKGYIQFRKQYQGQEISRSWPLAQKEKAESDIYDLLLRMSKNEKLILELEHRMLVEEACDTYYAIHSPSLKVRESCMPSEQPAYNLKCRLNTIKEAWKGRFFDAITKYDVRDLLSRFDTVGTQMKFIGTITHMFRSFQEWNEEGNILKTKVKLPAANPGTKWRKMMKPVQKREMPRKRVLTREEWDRFKVHLTDRARQVCETWLFQFLNISDIKNLHKMTVKGCIIEGVREKSGMTFQIPMLANQPSKYDTTNFDREFHKAQVAAKMEYPKDHPLHFTGRDLRRTGATWYYRKTKDLEGLRKMLGHAKITTTVRYLGLDETDMAQAVAVMRELANAPELENKLENFPLPGDLENQKHAAN